MAATDKFTRIEHIVSENDQGLRIDRVLAKIKGIDSRSQAAKLIQQGLVSINNKKLKSSSLAEEGQLILIQLPQISTAELKPYNFPIEIVFEDDDLVVVNKPAGLVVHPSAGHKEDTLVNALIQHDIKLSTGGDKFRPGIVHRLDKDTSGLIVIAKNNVAHEKLSQQFKDKTAFRKYHALVFGKPNFTQKTVESYLVRHPKDRKKFCSEKIYPNAEPKGKFAKTHFTLLALSVSGISLLDCQLETGRTHQIRIHAHELGYSIIGDNIYGSPGRIKNLKSTKLRGIISHLQRIGLNAYSLGFIHPTTNEKMNFSIGWPMDLQPFLDEIKLELI